MARERLKWWEKERESGRERNGEQKSKKKKSVRENGVTK